MDPKEQFDRLMQIANFAIARSDARHDYEWKLSFGVWAAAGAALLYLKATAFPWPIGVAVALVYVFWLDAVRLRNKTDVDLAYGAARRAASLFPQPLKIPEFEGGPTLVLLRRMGLLQLPDFIKGRKWLEYTLRYIGNVFFVRLLFNWSMRLQLGVTVALIVLFYLMNVDQATLYCFKNVRIERGEQLFSKPARELHAAG